MSRSALFLTLVLASLAGCASSPQADEQQAADAPKKVRCDREMQIGSAVPKKDCSAPLTEEEKQRLAAELRARTTPTGVTAPGK